MIFNPNEYHAQLPLPATEKWRDGVWDIEAFKHGSMSLIYFSPEGTDYQTPHSQDEWYFVLEGSGVIEIEGKEHSFSQGAAIFVAAGENHKFLGNLNGIKMWALFYGPNRGEKSA